MARKPQKLFTIGYEKAAAGDVLAEIAQAKIDLLVDVRAVAASRRPGFSKRQLASALDQHGIAYLHLRGLGTPKEGRLAARSGHLDTLSRIYHAHLKTPEARAEMDELAELARTGRRICLLCYERDVHDCHRQWIAEEITQRLGVKAEHLASVPRL